MRLSRAHPQSDKPPGAGLLICAEDGDDVLSVTEQADDIEVTVGLEVEPLHRKAGHSPGTQARQFAQLPHSRGAHRRHALNGFERRDGRWLFAEQIAAPEFEFRAPAR